MSKILFKSTAVVSGMTFLSRILGFLRDIVIARMFGAGIEADAFFVAFKIPNFLRRLFAEGAFSQAFIPVLAEYREKGDQPLKNLIAETGGTLSVILIFTTAAGVLGAPLLIMIFAPGFVNEPAKQMLAGQMLMITFPYILFISLTAFAGTILNSFNKFAVPAFTPVFLNLSLITATLWLSPQLEKPIMALAWGVLFGGIIQLMFQIPFLFRLGLLRRPRWGWAQQGVQKIIKLMIPAIFGVSIAQINLLIDTLLASLLVTGSISWLYYSNRLVDLPLGMFGIALSTVILPSLSRQHATRSLAQFSDTIDWALRWVFMIGTPATIGLILLAEPMMLSLFQYGEFSATDAHKASLSLMAYGAGLLPFILIKILAPGYFARQDTKTPVKIGIVTMLCNMILNVILMWYLAHVGLALATALSAMLNAGLLYQGLIKQKIYQPGPGWTMFAIKLFLANVMLIVFLLLSKGPIEPWLNYTAWERGIKLSGLISIAILLYFTCLRLTGFRLRELIKPDRH